MKKRLLITGSNGMLGGTLVKIFQQDYEVYATGTRENSFEFVKNYKPFDLKVASYKELIKWSDPDIILHCAALTNGNYCQENPMEAFQVNGVSLQKFIDCVEATTRIIYISTDAVFSSQVHMATESDCTSPENVYGKSKELGEFFLQNSELDYTIVRTTIVGLNFEPSKRGFVEWIIDAAKSKKDIQLFDDVLFTPISIWDLAEQLEHIFRSGSRYSGKVLHIAGRAPCTKYEFGMELLKALDVPREQIKKGSIWDMQGRAKRSTDQTLDSSYFETSSARRLPDLIETVTSIKENYKHYEKH